MRDQPIRATALGQWSAAGSAVFISALVAGRFGGKTARRHAIAGACLAFVIALLGVALACRSVNPGLAVEVVEGIEGRRREVSRADDIGTHRAFEGGEG
jgi:hypothetical protein